MDIPEIRWAFLAEVARLVRLQWKASCTAQGNGWNDPGLSLAADGPHIMSSASEYPEESPPQYPKQYTKKDPKKYKDTRRNLLMKVAYDGTDFSGWQIQPRQVTIQGLLVSTLEEICGEKITVYGAGRTDAGVHAEEQAANVRLASRIPCSNLVKALNDHLPGSIRILSIQEAAEDFHARYDACSKTYRYRIFRGRICPPWLCRYVFHFPYPLQEEAMQEAAKYFEGTRNFRSFTAADGSEHPDESSFIRTVFSSQLQRQADELVYTVAGNGFLYHMVRNIVGTLLEVGSGRISPRQIPEILSACHRTAAGPTASARGLHLIRVTYQDAPPSDSNPLDKQQLPGRIE